MKYARKICSDDRGSVTLWNLFWLSGFCLILGIGLDVTTAMHTKARLQTVADASAHAGVYDIAPDTADAVVTAVDYSFTNMPKIADVVNDTDVVVGWWDHDTKTFDTDSPKAYNAVQVIATRDNQRMNPTDTSFLGIVGFHAWDINAVALAASLEITQIDCRANGLFAGGRMEQTSNNTIVAPFCVYGDTSFKISQNNLIQCGVQLITPSTDTFHNGTPPVPVEDCDKNYGGLSNDQMIAQSFRYAELPIVADKEYENAKRILEKFALGQDYNDPYRVIPPYLTSVDSPSVSAFNNLAKQGNLVPGTLYHVTCGNSNKRLELTGIVQNIGVYTDCKIAVKKDTDVSEVKPTKTESGSNNPNLCDTDQSDCAATDWLAEITENYWSCDAAVAADFESYTTELDTAGGNTYADGETVDLVAEECGIEPGANGLWDNVMIFTSYQGNGNIDQKAITFPNNMQLGRIDGCKEGGGVRVYSAGSFATPSGTTAHGLQVVTLGSFQLAAKANGVMGINVQAMGDIKYTANGLMGGCPVDPDAGMSEVVITVRPVALVQ